MIYYLNFRARFFAFVLIRWQIIENQELSHLRNLSHRVDLWHVLSCSPWCSLLGIRMVFLIRWCSCSRISQITYQATLQLFCLIAVILKLSWWAYCKICVSIVSRDLGSPDVLGISNCNLYMREYRYARLPYPGW